MNGPLLLGIFPSIFIYFVEISEH